MADLITAGDVFHDPTTNSYITMIELRRNGFVIEQRVAPGSTRTIQNHFHKTWTETFEIISGTGRYKLDGKEYEAPPGHTFIVRPGQTHVHPWNPGTEELHFRQSDLFAPADPTAAVDTFLAFSTLAGLAKDGKSFRDGKPMNPLQAAITADFLRQHGGYLVGTPVSVQDVLLASGAKLAQTLGYRPWYEKYLPKNMK